MGFTITGGMSFTGGGMTASVAPSPSGDTYFPYTVMLLPGNGTNNGTNNTFLDGSTNNFTITRNGNTTQGTFSPYSQTGWGNYFDGNGDYLSFTNNTAIGSGSFTLECWVYLLGTPSVNYWIYGYRNGADTSPYLFISGASRLPIFGGDITNYVTGTSIPLYTWTHIAVVRNGTSMTLYQNGVSTATATTSQNFSYTGSTGIARSITGTTYYYNGYISNFRIVVGTAVYTSAFTPPTAPLTAISGTSLLTAQSNRFIDNSTNNIAITPNGDTAIQSFSPFNPTSTYSSSVNGGSSYFDGTGDYLSIADNTALQLGSSDFTWEGWFYLQSTANQTLIYSCGNTSSYAAMRLVYDQATSKLQLLMSTNGSTWAVNGGFSSTAPKNTWIHVAVVRSGTAITAYQNGVSAYSTTLSGTSYAGTLHYIGALNNAGSQSEILLGYASNVRLVKGTAVYTGAFTPPTAPLTAIANTSLLCNFTNGQITDATSKNDLETIAGANISTTQSKWGGSSMFFDGVDDYLTKPHDNILNFDDGNFTIESWIYITSTTAEGIAGKGFASTGAWLFWIQAGQLRFRIYSAAATSVTVTSGVTTVTANTWSHVAAVRNGSTITLYLNGTDVGSASYTGTGTNSSLLTVGCYTIGSPLSPTSLYDGYMNDFRITRGIARYTSNFTAPTAAFPTY